MPPPSSNIPTSHPSRNHLPGLREARKLSAADKEAWLNETMTRPEVLQWIKDRYPHQGEPCTIHHLAAECRKELKYFLPYTPATVGLYLLELHYIYNKRVCGFCPSSMPDSERYHYIKDCPTASSVAPAAFATFIAGHPYNGKAALMDIDPAVPLLPPPPST
eukprot:jgi/Ulvmu1/1618/UM112_0004.1